MLYNTNNFIILRITTKFIHLIYVQEYFKISIWTIRSNFIQKTLENLDEYSESFSSLII